MKLEFNMMMGQLASRIAVKKSIWKYIIFISVHMQPQLLLESLEAIWEQFDVWLTSMRRPRL